MDCLNPLQISFFCPLLPVFLKSVVDSNLMRSSQGNKKVIHFSGICGTGMGSLAVLLKMRGHHIHGSDENIYPPMSDFLAQNNIAVQSGFSVKNLETVPDLIGSLRLWFQISFISPFNCCWRQTYLNVCIGYLLFYESFYIECASCSRKCKNIRKF